MIGEIYKNTPISAYQPSDEVVQFTKMVKDAYADGVEILTRSWTELNNRSVIEDQNRGQMMFNAFVDTSVEDPKESWKWRGTRSMARNKGIAMHANLTAAYLLPLFVAQNENDEIDRDFSEVMQDIIEWLAQPINSNYQSSFLQIVFGMETNPVTFLGAEFCEVYQKIKKKTKDGKLSKEEVLDEVLSGFQAPIWSASQVLIANAYERNIQKQKCIIKRRFVEKSELEAKYGEHENWKYVRNGIKSIYNDQDGLFYDIKDDEHSTLVAEETYLNRREDIEVCFINGIYFGDGSPENNPIKHRDHRNCPKYNVVPFGYYRIGEHFFYYKSMMNALGWDNMLIDAMYEVGMNNELLQQEMPIAVSGVDRVDSEVVFPGSVVALSDKDSKITNLLPPRNSLGAFNAMSEIEKSMADASVNDTMAGNLPEASQKAYTVAQAQSNAKVMIRGVGRSLAESVIQYGDLMKDIVLNNITVPQVEELTGGKMKMKYKSFLLENKVSGGKMMDRSIKFDEGLIGQEMTDQELTTANLKLLEESGYPETKKSIRIVNPEMFAKFKYLCKVDIEQMFTKSQEYWQPILSALYAQLANNPLVNQEGLLRKLLYSYFNSEGDDLIQEQQGQLPVGSVPEVAGSNMPQQVLNKQTAQAVTPNII